MSSDEFLDYAEQVRWMRLPWIYRVARNLVVHTKTLMGWPGVLLVLTAVLVQIIVFPSLVIHLVLWGVIHWPEGPVHVLKERARVRIKDWRDPSWN